MIKRSAKEWDKIVAEYYETEPRTTIKEYCRNKKISTGQFHYNKKRYKAETEIEEIETKGIFQKIELNPKKKEEKSENNNNVVKIIAGKINIEIPTKEREMITFLIKELVSDVKS